MSDNQTAKWYFDQAKQINHDHYIELFLRALKKYNVSWCSATKQQRCFIEEVVRITIEREEAENGTITFSQIRPAFSA